MKRFLAGELTEEAFLPLRLQNGLYIQKHAPMLRVAVPYGMLSSNQLREIARITEQYDRGYCHITTRQNIQFNWIEMAAVPDILSQLAKVEMHAIQTSGNCIRNTTSDPLAGAVSDEIEDPRPYCEIIRQWSALHPEFAFLPRKFKIAVIGSENDRASIQLHDIGLQLIKNQTGETGFRVWAGGGLGRTPMLASRIKEFLPKSELLGYLKAILRVYNRYGRRDNKYKARIKILVNTLGAVEFANQVEQEFSQNYDADQKLTEQEFEYARSFFSAPDYTTLNYKNPNFKAPNDTDSVHQDDTDPHCSLQPEYDHWLKRNVQPHYQEGYAIVTLSLKHIGKAPGDITTAQLQHIADLAERYSFGEVRTTQQQNIVLADVRKQNLYALWLEATSVELATPTIGTLSDTVCCPGGDFCALANARSLPINSAIQQRFDDLDYLYDLGDLSLRISGCINACAHHHIANIGILGVEKNGQEYYQITLGGESGTASAIGKVLGPSLPMAKVTDAVENIVQLYLAQRTSEDESFSNAYRRIGKAAFKDKVYATDH